MSNEKVRHSEDVIVVLNKKQINKKGIKFNIVRKIMEVKEWFGKQLQRKN